MDYEEVASLLEDLEQSPLVEWGLWPGEEQDGQLVRIRSAPLEAPAAEYLADQGPPDSPAWRLERALARFLGRE